MNKKEILLYTLLALMMIANVANIITMPRQSALPNKVQEEFKNELATLVENSDKPVIIDRYTVGDDVEPQVHTVYAVKIPFKRYVGDDQIFIYTTVE